MKTVGVGVIALGWMGRLHARGYRAITERYPELGVRVRLVAAADTAEQNRTDAVEVLGFERACADYRDLLADPDVEAVSICAPNFLHHEIALAAIAAGKPFWIEKPMGVSAAQSADIARGAHAAGLATSVGFNYRHMPAVMKARELVRTGALGRITNVRLGLLADYASSPEGPLTWRYSKAQAGSGIVGDLLSHGSDLVHFLVGRIAEVTAMTGTFIDTRPIPLGVGIGHSAVAVSDERGPVENEDYVGVLARTDDGVLCTLESSRVSVGPRAEYIVEIYGTGGSVRWNFEHPNHLQVVTAAGGAHYGYVTVMTDASHGDYARFQPVAGMTMSFDDAKTVEAKLFLESVLNGTQVAPSAADGWAAAEVAEAVVRSAADGRWHPVATVSGPTTYDR